MLTEEVLLADYTTLRLGGPAARFVRAAADQEIVAEVRSADQVGDPVLVLGGGSNLVVADEGFPGTVVQIASSGIEMSRQDGVVAVTAAAGEDWDALVQRCIAEGLAGIECLSGIPGLTGATPIQNVGAYGQEVAQTITSVRAYDRLLDHEVVLPAAECAFGYRTSMFKRQATKGRGAELNPATATGRHVVLSVTFRLAVSPLSEPVRYAELARALGVAEGERVPLADARAAVLQLRRGKGMVLDPADLDTRSAGSFFTNPVIGETQFTDLSARIAARGQPEPGPRIPHWDAGDALVKLSAAWLIEQAGFRRGFPGLPGAGAQISTKHTLALTSRAGGSTADLVALARQVRDGVQREFGVQLVNEPTLVGTTL
jgi:UDP-N-acetylmuramate dehydrogenase